jgi:hypothetical protein
VDDTAANKGKQKSNGDILGNPYILLKPAVFSEGIFSRRNTIYLVAIHDGGDGRCISPPRGGGLSGMNTDIRLATQAP